MNAMTTINAKPRAGNELFLSNMEALWRCDAALALAIDAVPDERRLTLEATRSGACTAAIDASPDRHVYLHSRYDPHEEAARLIDSVEFQEKYAFVVSGLGLGYHVLELFQRLRGDAFIICIEPSVQVIATAMTCLDFSEAIGSGKLILLVDADKGRLHDRLAEFSTLIMLGMEFVQHPASVRAAGNRFAPILEAIKEFVTFTRMSLLTLVSNSRVTCQNIAMNLVSYLSSPPIDGLRDRFKNNPAVIIAAGPSLRKNIDQLAALKGKAVLCAVQTAIKPLMKHRIEPDFVTSLDFHEMSRMFFQGVGDLSGVHLVAEPKATWHVIDEYPGPVSLLDNAWARLLVGESLGARDGLKAGATVAHLAYYLAVYMGCDPIIFVGQDLAFTGHVFYTPGVEIHLAWQSELNRFCSMEHKEWDRIVRNREILRKVPSVDGGEVYTDELLLTYLEQFEKDIATTAATVIDATQGGARIRGTEVMDLAQAVERYCRDPIDPNRFDYRSKTQWRFISRLPEAIDELKARLAELDEAIDVCAEVLSLLRELESLTNDPLAFNRRLIRIDELRTRISQETRPYQIVSATGQLAELRRFSADRRISADRPDERERAELQIRRDTEFISSVRDGCEDAQTILRQAMARMIERVEQA
ncbi:MAG: motility associated factor glycosyltransferase family protein [Phycisphaerae bacterium]